MHDPRGSQNNFNKVDARNYPAVFLLPTQRALRDRLMSRGKNCLPTVSRQFFTHNYPRPNCLLKCLPNCLSPTREGFSSSFKINPAVRVIARQVRDKNCLAAIFAPRHQSVSSGPLGSRCRRFFYAVNLLKCEQQFFLESRLQCLGGLGYPCGCDAFGDARWPNWILAVEVPCDLACGLCWVRAASGPFFGEQFICT